MSYEQAVVASLGNQMLAYRAQTLSAAEVCKGCLAELIHHPVALEPVFIPVAQLANPNLLPGPAWTYEPPAVALPVRLQAWLTPDREMDWSRAERFLKQLQSLRGRFGLELSGNSKAILISFLCQEEDAPVIKAVFQAEHAGCELTSLSVHPLSSLSLAEWGQVAFHDYFPCPPYYHLLTRPSELQSSPLESLMAMLAMVPEPAIGFLQVLAQPVHPSHNWHRNVEILQDLEFTQKTNGGMQSAQRYGQQMPSGDLRQMAFEVNSKAHNDKPFFACTFRLAVAGAGDGNQKELLSLHAFSGLFQHGGRPLQWLDQTAYTGQLSVEQQAEMFLHGLTYRPGFLLNSEELAGLIHLPPAVQDNGRQQVKVDTLDVLAARTPGSAEGTPIGYVDYAGVRQPVIIDPDRRNRHTHLPGRPSMGKSSLMEHMALDDMAKGHGVAVLDPHGDLIERLLRLIPENLVPKVIYLNPGDPDWVPIWNPLARLPGQELGQVAKDIVRSIKGFVSNGWGDRLEHLLHNMFFGAMHLPGTTFFDIYTLLRNKSDEAGLLRAQILKVLNNEAAKLFWLHDYPNYKEDAMSPPKNKLSKLLISGTVSLMLSQTESRVNFREIMDQGQILLIDLSTAGTGLRDVLGCFLLSLFYCAALGRTGTPDKDRKQFHLYLDEAHIFLTDTLEETIAECRKYNLSLVLAHQFLSQFDKVQVDALSSVGSTVIFNLDSKDARYLTKDLSDKANDRDITSLKRGEAIARIGTDVIRFNTLPSLEVPTRNFREQIVQRSRRLFCRPASEVQREINRRNGRWAEPVVCAAAPEVVGGHDGTVREFTYAEWE